MSVVIRCSHPTHASRAGQPGWSDNLGTADSMIAGMVCAACAPFVGVADPVAPPPGTIPVANGAGGLDYILPPVAQGPKGDAGPQGQQGLPGTPGLPGTKGPTTIGSYNVLTNVGAAYDAVANAKGLGIALIDFTGYTSIDFRAFVSKVGTGIQSWQLWNVTDGTQLAVIDDPAASAAGDKMLNITVAIAVPIVGKKVVRVRAKSTVAADDPVFYGAAVALS